MLVLSSEKERRTLNNFRDNLDYVCDRCSAIPWETGPSKLNVSPVRRRRNPVLPEIEEPFVRISESLETLAQSSCRICRFIAAFLPHDRIGTGRVLSWSSNPSRKNVGRVQDFQGQAHVSSHIAVSSSESLQSDLVYFRDAHPLAVNTHLVKRWINTCKSSHDSCRLPKHSPRPENLTVIDCERLVVVPLPKGRPYIALSYVWGEASNQHTSEDFDLHKDLPRTIQHSITLTQNLGYKYLWVDRYCIDQHDNEGKHAQIMQMGTIYAAAQLTLIAAAGTDADHGLPGVDRESRQLKQEKVGAVHLTALPCIEGLLAIEKSWWAARAWTFQEGFFARRRLVFTEHQVFYICNRICEYEIKQKPSDAPIARLRLNRQVPPWLFRASLREDEDPMMRAMQYLEQYSTRYLSYDADALNAIVGALNTLSSESIYHLWGVPLRSPSAESGQTTVRLQTRQNTEAERRRISRLDARNGDFALLWRLKYRGSRRQGFPSWSPVGWRGPIKWHLSVTASTSGISISSESVGIKPLLYFAHPLAAGDTVSRYLELLLGTADFQVVTHVRSPDFNNVLHVSTENEHSRTPYQSTYDSTYVALPFQDTLMALYTPHWDADASDLALCGSVKGILIKQDILNPSPQQDDCVLLVKDRGQCYERVGIFWFLPYNTGRWGEKEMQVCDADFQSQPEKLHSKYQDPKVMGRWWRKHFKEEKIRLG